jgi:hypothetical protein
VNELAVHLRKHALQSGTPTSLKRIEFVNALNKHPSFEKCDPRELSVLYGVFDPVKRNVVQFVEVLASFVVLLNEKDDSDTKLGQLWDLYDSYGNDKSQFEKAFACLVTVCSCDKEYQTTTEYFKSYLRPTCYRASILQGNRNGTRESDEDGDGDFPSPKKTPGLSVQPAYNITESYLNKETFISAVKQCAFVSQHFSNLLGDRLTTFYGKDTRAEGREKELLEKQRNNKFKWMQQGNITKTFGDRKKHDLGFSKVET